METICHYFYGRSVIYLNFHIFTEAAKRLKELELEKQRLDAELKAAQQKISRTELNTEALHVHLRVRKLLKFLLDPVLPNINLSYW